MKKKILFIHPFLCEGGVERSLIRMLMMLSPEKYDITLYLYKSGYDLLPFVPDYVNVIKDTEEIAKKQIPGYTLNAKTKLFELLGNHKKAEKCQEKLKTERMNYMMDRMSKVLPDDFDVVVSYSLHIGTQKAVKIPAKRHYLFIHSSDPEYEKASAVASFEVFDDIFCVSEAVTKVMSEAYPQFAGKMKTLRNYVDYDRLVEASQSKKVAKNPVFTICSVGRLSPEKGFAHAADAAKILKDGGREFLWVIFGDGTEKEALQRQIDTLGLSDCVKLPGRIENPYPFVAACDLYVQPSLEEAQPLTLIEAQILGRAIVSTRTVGGDFILRHGERGILTDFTPKALADGIAELYDDDEKRKGFEFLYTKAENDAEKQTFLKKWDDILQGNI